MGTRHVAIVCAAAAVVALSVSPVCAQEARPAETRDGEWAAEQAKKAAELKAYEPSAAERWFVNLRREFLDLPSGFYP